ncbi:MAG: response regulator transcription factor [Elusimicrobia bacterium]|nr:response regulator transcription factor [Elusimicrobiota bacterium]
MTKILVVDDEEAVATLLAEHLSARGHSVSVCIDSSQAERVALQEKHDLAIIDYAMPIKDGITLLADLRTHEKTARMPVIFLSGTDAVRYSTQVPPEPRVRFMRKPVNMDVLAATIGELLDPESWSSAS